jgi:CRISPR-associated protein Csm4
MKLIKFRVFPKSTFASLPIANMIFGHFAKLLYLKKDNRIDSYLDNPSIIFSDFLPDDYCYKPTLPLEKFDISEDDKKEFRKKEFIKIKFLQNGELSECEKLEFFENKQVIRNKINRNTFTTGENEFAPYSIDENEFKTNIVLYVLFDENTFKKDDIEDILNEIGKSGFGKKSSIGKGQFEVSIDESFSGFKSIDTDYYITLSSTIFKKEEISLAYYDVDTIFGKFHSTNKPFKKPVLFAKAGAVVKTKEKKEYIGKAIDNSYFEDEKSFVQGYSIVLPFDLKDKKC